MTREAFRRIDTLLQVGLRLARTAPSGRVALARIAAAIELEWIPPQLGEELAAELRKASEAVREPLNSRRVERVLRDAWGAAPSAELDDLDPEPAAVTPGAQVHRGALDGQPVAIKLLRPGLAATVRQDMVLLEGLIAPLRAAFPALDAAAMVREVRERVLDELDLEHEGTIQRRFHRALRDHPFLTVPAPISRLTHDNVLVSEWVDGVPLWDAPNPDQAARRLVVFALGAARFGIIHADPLPDDVLVLPDGGLAILDFGATRTVEKRRVDLTAAALAAFSSGDDQGLGRALKQLGTLPAPLAVRALELGVHALGERSGPTRLDSDGVIAARERMFERPDALNAILHAGKLAPEDLWPARGAATMLASIARVGATAPWLELSLAALNDGWNAAEA